MRIKLTSALVPNSCFSSFTAAADFSSLRFNITSFAPFDKRIRATEAVPCVPAVFEPCVIAIVSGGKETVLDGKRYVYDSSEYMCCPMSMPVEAGTPAASAETPLYGVYIALDQRLMTQITIEMDAAGDNMHPVEGSARGIRLVRWDNRFLESLLRLV